MNAKDRRDAITARLEQATEPVNATALARGLDVSRQVIVGDIALLRAAGTPIEATPRGYVLSRPAGVSGQVVCCHRSGDMETELNTLVDLGCVVEDVSVEHPVYGQLTGFPAGRTWPAFWKRCGAARRCPCRPSPRAFTPTGCAVPMGRHWSGPGRRCGGCICFRNKKVDNLPGMTTIVLTGVLTPAGTIFL